MPHVNLHGLYEEEYKSSIYVDSMVNTVLLTTITMHASGATTETVAPSLLDKPIYFQNEKLIKGTFRGEVCNGYDNQYFVWYD